LIRSNTGDLEVGRKTLALDTKLEDFAMLLLDFLACRGKYVGIIQYCASEYPMIQNVSIAKSTFAYVASDASFTMIRISSMHRLCVVAIDKAHIHVQHGKSFRSKICALQSMFFEKIFGNQPERMMRPRLIVMTATLPTNYLPPLCCLLSIPLLSGDLIVRGSANNFEQREIEMRTYICSLKGQFVSRGLTMIAEFIRANPTKSVVVFCNSRRQSQHFRDHLERKLNKMKLNIDVIHINGSLHKIDKFWRIRLFCDKGHIREADF
jgi:hypothetical protein